MMHVIHRGEGPLVLVALIVPLTLMLVGVLISLSFENASRVIDALVTLGLPAVGMLVAGFMCLRWGRRLNRETNFHTLYWIPIQYWALFFWACGLLSLVGLVIILWEELGRS